MKKTTAFTVTLAVAPNILFANDYIKSGVENSLENGDLEVSKSINFVGKNEVKSFKQLFNVYDNSDFKQKVMKLQRVNMLGKVDGILGEETLRLLYIKYYPNNYNLLPEDVKIRLEEFNKKNSYNQNSRITNGEKNSSNFVPNELNWINDIHEEMSTYPEHKSINGVKVGDYKYVYSFLRKLKKSPNARIYGNGLSKNISGTFINNDLFGKFPDYLPNGGNKIIIEKFGGKKVMRVYVDGYLEIATYVSPGKNSTRTPRYFKKLNGTIDKYHASSNNEYKGAAMPYGVLVDGVIGIWLHGSGDRVDGKGRSHGCIRVPLFYQKKLYELFKSGTNFEIDTRKIY